MCALPLAADYASLLTRISYLVDVLVLVLVDVVVDVLVEVVYVQE